MKRKEEWEMIPIITIDTNIVIRAFKGDEECKNIINNKICSFCSNRDWIIIMATAGFWRIWLIQFFFIRMFYCKQSREIKKSAITIRKNYNLKVPDAIIAATAITKNFTLFSADDIFKRISQLNFVYVSWAIPSCNSIRWCLQFMQRSCSVHYKTWSQKIIQIRFFTKQIRWGSNETFWFTN